MTEKPPPGSIAWFEEREKRMDHDPTKPRVGERDGYPMPEDTKPVHHHVPTVRRVAEGPTAAPLVTFSFTHDEAVVLLKAAKFKRVVDAAETNITTKVVLDSIIQKLENARPSAEDPMKTLRAELTLLHSELGDCSQRVTELGEQLKKKQDELTAAWDRQHTLAQHVEELRAKITQLKASA